VVTPPNTLKEATLPKVRNDWVSEYYDDVTDDRPIWHDDRAEAYESCSLCMECMVCDHYGTQPFSFCPPYNMMESDSDDDGIDYDNIFVVTKGNGRDRAYRRAQKVRRVTKIRSLLANVYRWDTEDFDFLTRRFGVMIESGGFLGRGSIVKSWPTRQERRAGITTR
jgi:hypothetical protein